MGQWPARSYDPTGGEGADQRRQRVVRTLQAGAP